MLEQVIIVLLVAFNVVWFIYLHRRLNDIQAEIKKGNKDQQEIKTKLTNIRKRQYDMQTAVKNTLLKALQKSVIAPAKKK